MVRHKEFPHLFFDINLSFVSLLSSDGGSGKRYIHTHNGLFPAPLGRNAKSSAVSKVKTKFKFLGRFMAKALMDSRMVRL